MTKQTLDKAINEAKRFIKAAEQVKVHSSVNGDTGKLWYYLDAPTKASGACKRASMDLTRALAEMRKP